MRKKDFNYYSGKKYDGMIGRCYRPTNRSYKNYGKRRIKVCSAWIKDIEAFRKWLASELSTMKISKEEFVENSSKIQLDRRDTNGHYTPENCRLVASQVNMRNRRATKYTKFESAEGEE